jgi:hypothetical protein
MAQARQARELAERQMASAERIAATRAAGKGAGKEGQPLKETQLKPIQALESIASGLENLKKDFKDEYASLGVLGFGANFSLEAKRRLGDAEGAKAVAWWGKYERLQAPNRHSLFGATLTGNELKNYQSFTAKPSDSPEVVKNFLQDQINYSKGEADNKKTFYEDAGYKVQDTRPISFESTYSKGETVNVGGQTYTRPSNFTDQQWSDYKKSVGAE